MANIELIRKVVNCSLETFHMGAKQRGESLVHVIAGFAVQAKKHGAQVWFYLDGKRTPRGEAGIMLTDALAQESTRKAKEKAEEDAAIEDLFGDGSQMAQRPNVAEYKQLSGRIERLKPTLTVIGMDPAELGGDRTVGGFLGRCIQVVEIDSLSKLDEAFIQGYKERRRARKYVGRVKHRQTVHRDAIGNEYYELCEYHSKPAKVKRAKRLAKILRILEL